MAEKKSLQTQKRNWKDSPACRCKKELEDGESACQCERAACQWQAQIASAKGGTAECQDGRRFQRTEQSLMMEKHSEDGKKSVKRW